MRCRCYLVAIVRADRFLYRAHPRISCYQRLFLSICPLRKESFSRVTPGVSWNDSRVQASVKFVLGNRNSERERRTRAISIYDTGNVIYARETNGFDDYKEQVSSLPEPLSRVLFDYT